MTQHFSEVTELAGTEISTEQLERMSHRYHWAAQFCRGKDVVEVACGSGQGLGVLAAVAKTVEAGDISAEILSGPQRHYAGRVQCTPLDAQALPFADASKDVVVLFEALYYIADAPRFVRECKRVLRAAGEVLVSTANKDLADFNPSPFSQTYYGARELPVLFTGQDFDVELFGHLPVAAVSWRQKVLRPLKQVAVALGVVPKTMAGKRLLKRLVFGKLIEMPAELPFEPERFQQPTRLSGTEPDRHHKVIYARARLRA